MKVLSDEWWNWHEAGCPQRWAFWRRRDEFDGLCLGVVLGLIVVAVVIVLW